MIWNRSLRARYLRTMLVMIAVFIAAALYFHYRVSGVDQAIREHFQISQQMHLVHEAESAAIALLSEDMKFFRDRTAETLTHDHSVLDTLEADAAALVAKVHDVVDGRAPIDDLRPIMPALSALHHDMDRRVREAEARYRRDSMSVSLGLGVLLLIPVVLALWPLTLLGNVIHGVQGLREKVEQGRQTGDGRAVTVDRDDEIGVLANDIDGMFAALKEREQELERAQELRGLEQKIMDIASLGAGIAHEVRNPLTTMTAYLELFEGAVGRLPEAEQEDLADGVDGMRAAIERIERLLREITSFEWAGEDQSELDVNGLLSSVVGIVRLDERLRHSAFDVDLDPSVPAVMASRTGLLLSLYWLLSTVVLGVREEPGRVSVLTRKRDDALEITFRARKYRDNRPQGTFAGEWVVGYIGLTGCVGRMNFASVRKALSRMGMEFSVTAHDDLCRDYCVALPVVRKGGA